MQNDLSSVFFVNKNRAVTWEELWVGLINVKRISKRQRIHLLVFLSLFFRYSKSFLPVENKTKAFAAIVLINQLFSSR